MDVWPSHSQLELSRKDDTNLDDFGNGTVSFGNILGQDFSFLSEESSLFSLLDDCNSENRSNLIAAVQDDANPNKDEKQSAKDGKRKRREPEQVNAHILAERKRRELIAQRFIALSALIPGLKKVDKTSILEGAIEYFQQMQETIKTLEEDASKQVQVVEESATMFKRKHNDSLTCAYGSSGGGDGGNGSRNDEQTVTLPEVQVKVLGNALLLRISCVRRKGILGKIYNEMENRHINIVNCNAMPLQTSCFTHITIFAQMDATQGQEYEKHVKDLVKTLHSIL